MTLCDIANDRKTEADTTGLEIARGIRAVIGFRDFRQFLRGNAGAIIIDDQEEEFSPVLNAHMGALAVLDGVIDEVLQCAS